MISATTADAYRLFHEGTLALAEVEAAGMRIDVGRLERTTDEVTDEVSRLEADLKRDEVWKAWRKRFGDKASLDSPTQLAKVLYDDMGYEPAGETRTGRARTDEDSLDTINTPFVKAFQRMRRLKKLKGTYLNGIKRELVGEYIRPVENLHLVRTFRSSVDSPNVQNQINRLPEFAEMLRRCYIPRDGHVLTECDLGAQEFRIAACFWRDENMIAYASDPARDIHRDMASACYMLPKDQVPKQCRFYAKNQFVFPELYGSDYVSCARNLWSVIGSSGLKTADGVDLGTHLESKGIRTLGRLDRKVTPVRGTFVEHVWRVQRKFEARFPQWDERRVKWWDRYQSRGWFDLLTGFRCTGVYTYNEANNYPVQGPAFHCLLWALIRLVREMQRRKMRSRVVAQIHDSIVGDVHRAELDDYFELATRIMSEDVREAWPWIVTPLVVEREVAEPTWFDKRPYGEAA